MKKLVFSSTCAALLLTSVAAIAQNGFTQADRDKAVEHLKSSQKELRATVKGLSDAQLKFKSGEESWSVSECVEHLAISENSLFGIVTKSLEPDADPTRRSEVKMSDDQILGFIMNRTDKIKTQPYLEPTNSFGSYSGSLDEFKTKRKASIKFVKSTEEDLRSHYFEFPFGVVDSYQVIMFMSGHSIRHTNQIKEIIAQESFPSS